MLTSLTTAPYSTVETSRISEVTAGLATTYAKSDGSARADIDLILDAVAEGVEPAVRDRRAFRGGSPRAALGRRAMALALSPFAPADAKTPGDLAPLS
jgi:hypothetical protein